MCHNNLNFSPSQTHAVAYVRLMHVVIALVVNAAVKNALVGCKWMMLKNGRFCAYAINVIYAHNEFKNKRRLCLSNLHCFDFEVSHSGGSHSFQLEILTHALREKG
jgi:hypothetical protein